MKKLLLFFTFISFLLPQLEAQGPTMKKGKKNPALKAELRQHYQQTVYPVLKAEHDAFDALLSSEDYNFLLNKRAEVDLLRKERIALKKEAHALKKSGMDKESVKLQLAPKREALKNKFKTLGQSLQPFAERHQDLIKQSMEKLKPYHKEWKMERQAIRKKYYPEGKKPHPKKHKKGAHPKKGKKESKAKGKIKKKVVKFLLWDGKLKNDKKSPEMDENVVLEEDFLMDENSIKKFNLSLYPNPAQNEATIEFELIKKARNVSIKIVDFSNSIRAEISLENLVSGIHTVQLNLNGIENGQYVCILEVDGKQANEIIQIKN